MIEKKKTIDETPGMVESGILNYHVLEGMADWVRVVDLEGRVIFANQAMRKALGEDIVGEQCYKSYKRGIECNFCITKNSIQTGETVQKEEIINGQYFSVKSSPVKDSSGNINAAVQVFRNVTRERKLELELIDRNKKISKDLHFARRIQERVLPRRGRIENVEVDYIYKASEMLSGDMFDIFYIDDYNLGVYICDVAGHGIAASMMTMFIKETMRSIKDEITEPSLALEELHRRFSALDMEPDKYFTIFYGVYNKSTRRFAYSNAGHNCYPIKFNAREIEPLKIKGYPITMLFGEVRYKQKEVSLEIGDKVLLYTDGITEARDHNDIQFGIEGVIDTVKKNPDNMLKEIEDKFIIHSWGEQNDDYALVLLEVLE
ncbi:MAG: SpoIIE family protein phosphatase [Gudongella sp.]|jgi:sigma-B regulation protein RsbU (phosphoserine phosphatase)|nr:SpoIIE family protein phosphatase [Gudongella sp.]